MDTKMHKKEMYILLLFENLLVGLPDYIIIFLLTQVLSSTLQKCKKTISSVVSAEKVLLNFSNPSGVCVDSKDNIFICDTENCRVLKLTRDGKHVRTLRPTGRDCFARMTFSLP